MDGRGLRSRMPFPRNRIFPKKYRKFPVPSIREHPLNGPDSVPAFGTGCFPVSFISRIFSEFSQVTRPENSSLVPVPPIREMRSSLVSFKTSSGMQTSRLDSSALLPDPVLFVSENVFFLVS